MQKQEKPIIVRLKHNRFAKSIDRASNISNDYLSAGTKKTETPVRSHSTIGRSGNLSI